MTRPASGERAEVPTRPGELSVSRALVAALETSGARYVHWKSNEHLAPAMAGETDLDLLFDRRQYGLVRRVLADCGFRPFRTSDHAGYPGIEDHLAVDAEAGKLVHCHAHFLLSAGERYLKGYRIPWEERFLATARLDADTGVRVADPALELVTLLLRSAMKQRGRDRAAALAGRAAFRGGALAEYEWLRERAGADEVTSLARDLLGEDAARAVGRMLTSPPGSADLRRLRRAAGPTLDEWRTWRRPAALRARWAREVRAARSVLNRRTLSRTTPSRRVVPGGGIVVAFLGADGSGKSTVVREVSERLARKVDVLRLYFGSGDGPVSLLRSPLRPAARLARRRRLARSGRAGDRAGGERPADPREAAPEPSLILAGRIAWALSLAREKRGRLAAAWRARNRGLIVVADRYPQAQIAGFNDGPLLGSRAAAGGRFLRWAAAREEGAYRLAERQAPDLVVRLRVSPAVAAARKPDMTLDEIARRDAAIGALAWPEGTRVVDVDADQPLDDVLRDVMVAVWREL